MTGNDCACKFIITPQLPVAALRCQERNVWTVGDCNFYVVGMFDTLLLMV